MGLAVSVTTLLDVDAPPGQQREQLRPASSSPTTPTSDGARAQGRHVLGHVGGRRRSGAVSRLTSTIGHGGLRRDPVDVAPHVAVEHEVAQDRHLRARESVEQRPSAASRRGSSPSSSGFECSLESAPRRLAARAVAENARARESRKSSAPRHAKTAGPSNRGPATSCCADPDWHDRRGARQWSVSFTVSIVRLRLGFRFGCFGHHEVRVGVVQSLDRGTREAAGEHPAETVLPEQVIGHVLEDALPRDAQLLLTEPARRPSGVREALLALPEVLRYVPELPRDGSGSG